MKEYLIVYVKYEEVYNETGLYVINKIPIIENIIKKANNKKELINMPFICDYLILNIIELETGELVDYE